MHSPFNSITLLATLLWSLAGVASAQEEVEIGQLSQLDRHYMAAQRELLGDLTARHYGKHFTGTRDNDLELLQRLLDDSLVRDDQTRELQAMGVILGDLLAAELSLHWVIYTDQLGRSRALRYKNTENYLFPMTMISRRREAGNHTPVEAIFAKAKAAIEPAIPALPFQ